MYLERVEIQGFKSFAQKTVLKFLPPRANAHGITAIVGPNGSGKSNVADAIRWVLGEQSMKSLRGKKGEDVIFAGSDSRARLGFAEVVLVLNNSDHDNDIELTEIVITRRLYRDGDSEYLVNGRAARLQDIALLLARAHFGQKSYTVIGQGMIDAILLASVTERKEFFDEAAGIKEFQIKRSQAVHKLVNVRENMAQAEGLVREIEPRVKSLGRQVRKLEEREVVARELLGLQKKYYGKLWHELRAHLEIERAEGARMQETLGHAQAAEQKVLIELHVLEKATTQSDELIALQKTYEEIVRERSNLQEEHMKLRSRIEIERVRGEARKHTEMLPAQVIAERLGVISAKQDKLLELAGNARTKEEIKQVLDLIRAVVESTRALLRALEDPEENVASQKIEVSKDTESALKKTEQAVSATDARLKEVHASMQVLSQSEAHKKSQFFDLQRTLQSAREQVFAAQQKLNNLQVQNARYETRMETLEEEMQIEVPNVIAEVKLKPQEDAMHANMEDIHPQILRLKHHLELIGGIDQEVVEEYKATKERYDFLTREIEDLKKTLEAIEGAIKELDGILKSRRDEALKQINEHFGVFFKQLFNGGKAQLIPVFMTPEEEHAQEDEEAEENDEQESAADEREKGEPILAGFDIQATPPGKRIKDINILSGGERAMTSVALICAILAYHPSPFVVLDEVDAALDESNSVRFADIVEQLSMRTQFIVITHNRASMSKGDVLYGVTMGVDGVSKLLSVKLEDAEKMVKE